MCCTRSSAQVTAASPRTPLAHAAAMAPAVPEGAGTRARILSATAAVTRVCTHRTRGRSRPALRQAHTTPHPLLLHEYTRTHRFSSCAFPCRAGCVESARAPRVSPPHIRTPRRGARCGVQLTRQRPPARHDAPPSHTTPTPVRKHTHEIELLTTRRTYTHMRHGGARWAGRTGGRPRCRPRGTVVRAAATPPALVRVAGARFRHTARKPETRGPMPGLPPPPAPGHLSEGRTTTARARPARRGGAGGGWCGCAS